ncbi:hypothetical protein AKJ16_DCAP03385 [Drosera capensis]
MESGVGVKPGTRLGYEIHFNSKDRLAQGEDRRLRSGNSSNRTGSSVLLLSVWSLLHLVISDPGFSLL